jgi:histidine triad (HIT) family protein
VSDCPFCPRITAGDYDYEDDYTVAFQPLNPVTPGHWLAVPKVHVTDAMAAPEAAGHALRFAGEMAGQMDLRNCNFITSAGAAATQTVFHLHVHVVPRREGDGLLLPWSQQKIDADSFTEGAEYERERVALLAEEHGVAYARNIPGGEFEYWSFADLIREVPGGE